MLQSLMKPSPQNRSPPRSPTKKTTPKIAELAQLEDEIILKRPNNITQFIRDWASSKMTKMTLSKKEYDDSDYDDQPENYMKKGFRAERRFALRIDNVEFNEKMAKIERKEKLEETKSVILIKLKSLDILKGLNNQMLWELVQDFQEIEYKHEEVIIQRTRSVRFFYIIVSGSVAVKALNKKPIILNDGSHFGEDSLLFGTPSPFEYSSQGVSRVAHLQGRRISQLIREMNIQKYKTICRALEKIQFLKTLHQDEIDRVADIAMNQPAIYTEPQQQFDIESYTLSLFIVLKGLFYAFSRKLTQELRKEPSQYFKAGDAFGIESLRKDKFNDTVVSQDYGAIVEIRCNDIERIIGPLSKLSNRRRKRQ